MTGGFAVIAPAYSVSLPSAPEFPTLELTPSMDLMTQLGTTFYFIGSMIWFFFGYIAYMFLLTGAMVAFLSAGVLPPVAGTFLTSMLFVVLIGGILMYVRGQSDK